MGNNLVSVGREVLHEPTRRERLCRFRIKAGGGLKKTSE